jgi:pSer/pThr/pTyr-binding forkhead associated (FHA) protein
MRISQHRAHAVNQPRFPHLVALSEGVNIPLEKPIILIGRHQECDIQIPSRKISRRHCCIALITDHLVVRDLGSTNGIRINGIKVLEGNLQPNDELTIGNMRYQVKWDGESAKTTPAPAKQAVQVMTPPAKGRVAADESYDVPMPLPDVALAHPVLQGEPKQPITPPQPASIEIPDDVALAPLEPPPK